MTCITEGTTNITDPTQIANSFNNFYISIAENILKKRKYNGNKSYKDFLRQPLQNSFVVYECEENEIKMILKSLNPNKSYGPNSIPVTILHLLANDICKPLKSIFNISLSHGQYPDLLKIANSIPMKEQR